LCGFIDEPSEELCKRWQQLGAFYSFSRNHNIIGDKSQEPTVWPEESFNVMKTAMRTRYQLLLNLYTVIYETSKMDSGTVFRSLMTEFAYDNTALTVDYQFMWGESFMFAPIVHEGTSEVDVYFPEDTVWYQIDTENLITSGPYNFGVSKFNADKKVPIFIKGGRTVVVQEMKETDVTTVDMENNKITIVVAFDKLGEVSTGSLYIDDGLTVHPDYSYIEFNTMNIGSESEASFKFSATTKSEGSDLREIGILRFKFVGMKCPSTDDIHVPGYSGTISSSKLDKGDGKCDVEVEFGEDFDKKLGIENFQLYLGKESDDNTTDEPVTTSNTDISSFRVFNFFIVIFLLQFAL